MIRFVKSWSQLIKRIKDFYLYIMGGILPVQSVEPDSLVQWTRGLDRFEQRLDRQTLHVLPVLWPSLKQLTQELLRHRQVEDPTPLFKQSNCNKGFRTRRGGLEPPTSGFGDLRSTNWTNGAF